jgi:SAM-dependent methyltransferase
MTTTETYYDNKYFDWQAPIGEFGGWANLTKFRPFIDNDFNVIDFGCGGGYLLKNIRCKEKIGVEVNDSAREQAQQNGIRTVKSSMDIDEKWADLIISNHALEHVSDPLSELQNLKRLLKPNGKIVFYVPCESIHLAYRNNDVNQHLFTWSPMCLGNIFSEAGYLIEESAPYYHQWPPKNYRRIARWGGRQLFDFCCRLYAHWDRTVFQVRVIASANSDVTRQAA